MAKQALVLCLIILSACGYRYSKEPIPDVPAIDESFLQNSITYLDKMIQQDPENMDLYQQKLKIYKDQNWPREAITALNASIELDSSNLELVKMRKDYYLKNGSFRRGLSDIDFIINKGDDSKELALEKAIALYELNRIRDTWNTIDTYSLNTLEDSRLYKLKGDLLLLEGDTLLSLRNYYLYYLNDSKNAELNRKMINLMVATKNWNKASQVLEELSGNDSSYYLESALAKMNTGKEEEGKGIIRDLVESGDRTALFSLSDYYYESGKYDSVIYFNNYFANNYDSLNTSFIYIARSYDKKGWWTRALMYYDLVLQTDSTNQQALLETQKVKGKIAYLRKLKEEKERAPVNIILPKKKIDF